MSMLPSTSKKLFASMLAVTMLTSVPLVGISQSASAQNTSKQEANVLAAKRLNNLLAKTQRMTANFTQNTAGANRGKASLAGGRTFSGKMSVERPNKFRWETTSPSEQLVIANANNMWVYDKDLAQVTKQNIGNQIGNTPALLLSGDHTKIADNFNISQPHGDKNYYVLTPKSANATFKDMSISFNGGKPVMMVLNDNLGQTTSIKFSNIKLNPKISKSQFNFVVPDGVDLIEQ